MSRHDQQSALPEIGHEGQQIITKARILVVGVGALGSTAAELLCRAGVGELTLCDYDIVEESNLQRQSLYTTEDIGRLKVEAAKEHLIAIDPMCIVKSIPEPFSASTPLDGISVVVDGTDNLDSRLLLNDACRKTGVPLVIGTASGTRGLVFVARPGAACWQCIARGKTADDDCGSVLGPATHAIASLQVAATLRTLLGQAPKELVEFDAWHQTLRAIAVRQNPSCDACNGRYLYLNAKPAMHFCQSRSRVVARPNVPRVIDLEKARHLGVVLHDYGGAIQLRLERGTVLVHKHGAIEFSDVPEHDAHLLVEKLLGE